MRPVKDIGLGEGLPALLRQMASMGGFMGRRLGEAYNILREVLEKKDEVTVFMSFPAAPVSTGFRGVIREMLSRGWVDVVITTCGTWDHDLARSYVDYFTGSFEMDDRELRRREVHRLGNVLIPFDNYGVVIEKHMRRLLEDLYSRGVREISTYEFSWELGKYIGSEESLLYTAYKRDVEVIVPAPYDGAVGYNIWVFQQFHKDFKLDMYRDEKLLADAVYEASSTAGIVVGGGVSKHHLIWWNQFRGGLDYAVQISTAVEYDGSLSGARMSEAVSWNKVSSSGRYVSVWGDATILLPILVEALIEEGF